MKLRWGIGIGKTTSGITVELLLAVGVVLIMGKYSARVLQSAKRVLSPVCSETLTLGNSLILVYN